MTIQEFVNQSFENSKSHGWHDLKRSNDTMFMLMISEIAEASEEVRKDNPTVWYHGPGGKPTPYHKEVYDALVVEVGAPIKTEGECVELVDCLIRVFDFVGLRKIELKMADQYLAMSVNDLAKELLNHADPLYKKLLCGFPLDLHLEIVRDLVCATKADYTSTGLADVVMDILSCLAFRGCDPEGLINLKHNYNVVRPALHGGLKA